MCLCVCRTLLIITGFMMMYARYFSISLLMDILVLMQFMLLMLFFPVCEVVHMLVAVCFNYRDLFITMVCKKQWDFPPHFNFNLNGSSKKRYRVLLLVCIIVRVLFYFYQCPRLISWFTLICFHWSALIETGRGKAVHFRNGKFFFCSLYSACCKKQTLHLILLLEKWYFMSG